MRDLPMDLLRTFVIAVDRGGFTRAGEFLGRTQPAISLQMKRLESLVGVPILVRQGRRLLPTAEGQSLLGYARQILSLNDEAIANLVRPGVSGRVKLGIPNEFASSVLPRIVRTFARTNPNVTLEVTCELSRPLLQKLRRNEFDLVIALHERKGIAAGVKLWSEPLEWIGSREQPASSLSARSIVAAPAPCIYRDRMTGALNRQGHPWQIVYTSSSYGGICAAVSAGIGVTAIARSTVPEETQVLTDRSRFPSLPTLDVALHYDPERATPAVQRFAEYITETLGTEWSVPTRDERGRATSSDRPRI